MANPSRNLVADFPESISAVTLGTPFFVAGIRVAGTSGFARWSLIPWKFCLGIFGSSWVFYIRLYRHHGTATITRRSTAMDAFHRISWFSRRWTLSVLVVAGTIQASSWRCSFAITDSRNLRQQG